MPEEQYMDKSLYKLERIEQVYNKVFAKGAKSMLPQNAACGLPNGFVESHSITLPFEPTVAMRNLRLSFFMPFMYFLLPSNNILVILQVWVGNRPIGAKIPFRFSIAEGKRLTDLVQYIRCLYFGHSTATNHIQAPNVSQKSLVQNSVSVHKIIEKYKIDAGQIQNYPLLHRSEKESLSDRNNTYTQRFKQYVRKGDGIIQKAENDYKATLQTERFENFFICDETNDKLKTVVNTYKHAIKQCNQEFLFPNFNNDSDYANVSQ